MEIKKEKKETKFQSWVGYGAVLVTIMVSIGVSWILYQHTVRLLTRNLQGQLIAIVKTAAIQFDAEKLDRLHVESDYKKPEWEEIVKKLIAIRETNKDIVFAYILRKTPEVSETMEFVADSHSLDPYAKIDLDQNGVIDDADALNWPGQTYDDVPQEAFDGLIEATTNKELYKDQWGVLISGYAPIKNKQGKPVAVMVVDMRANNFFEITRQTFFPFLVFIIVLVGILLIQAGSLVQIWNKKIALMAELDRQKDELLGIVSHQLATPVSAIKWCIEMMEGGDLGKLTKGQQEHLQSMQSITVDLVDLVGMILDVSRIQLGKMKIDSSELGLSCFFNEIMNVIQPKVQEKKVQFVSSLPKEMPTVLLDKRLTKMTLENLLSNAIKYTPENGKIELKVNIRNQTLYCEVIDSGCGIPKEDQPKIFSKLFRASNVRNTIDGNGFGLYIAKGAIEGQGGKIGFRSTEGEGTTFFFNIPLKIVNAKKNVV